MFHFGTPRGRGIFRRFTPHRKKEGFFSGVADSIDRLVGQLFPQPESVGDFATPPEVQGKSFAGRCYYQIVTTQIDERQAGATPGDVNASAALTGIAASSSETPSLTSVLSACARFLRGSWLGVLVASAAVLVPCFWHKRIEAGDLGSHTYNAWLAQLIERGLAPGLWIANQWNNILFDASLSRLGNLVGLRLAERICVSAAVLIFFWGAFAMIAAMARRAPWPLTPCIAMLAYGWTFQQGFLNYYISLGLAFFGVALLLRGSGLERAVVLLILPLAWMAHPLGVAVLLGLGSYVMIAEMLPQRRHLVLLAGAAFLFLAATTYISSRFSVLWSSEGSLQTLLAYNGADQLVLYGRQYRLPSDLLIIFSLIWVALDARMRRALKESWHIYFLPLQLYGLALLAAVLLPSFVTLPGYAAPLGLLTARLTSVTAVLACCLLGVTRPQKWHFPCLAAIAAIFFLFLYSDTGKLNNMEEQAERYEHLLPPGQRIIATIWPFAGSRLLIDHVIDRACVAQCFSYANYEPASGQFRLRAKPGNRYVLSDFASADQAESGNYIVQTQDLPLFEIYQCNLNMTALCMRELAAGERNGAVGVHPSDPAQGQN